MTSRQPEPACLSDAQIDALEFGRRRNPGYHDEVDRLFGFLTPAGCRVLEIGCGTGRLLAGLRPSYGLGIDMADDKIRAARQLHANRPELEFRTARAEDLSELPGPSLEKPFDYIILSDLLPLLHDVDSVLAQLKVAVGPNTRLLVGFHSNLWRPVMWLATKLGRRQPDPQYNWLSSQDIKNLLYIAGFEVVKQEGRTLLPLRIPGLRWLCNRLLAKMPLFGSLCLTWTIVARPAPKPQASEGTEAPSVSVLIPTRNERGNIEGAFTRTPRMGRWTELVFVDGYSNDGTIEEIERCTRKYGENWHRVVLLHQAGHGKGDAVRHGFAACQGDILMILDSDLTMPPEELPKYYQAIVAGRGEMINGSRLVYPMQSQAMRFLNMIANVLFARLFTWLLGQPITDTLCGTKVLWREDYDRIADNRSYFGEFDPFGDFDLLFGAARLSRKIVSLPIHYADRQYGDIKIQRWRHGLLLLRMSLVAFRKLKLS